MQSCRSCARSCDPLPQHRRMSIVAEAAHPVRLECAVGAQRLGHCHGLVGALKSWQMTKTSSDGVSETSSIPRLRVRWLPATAAAPPLTSRHVWLTFPPGMTCPESGRLVLIVSPGRGRRVMSMNTSALMDPTTSTRPEAAGAGAADAAADMAQRLRRGAGWIAERDDNTPTTKAARLMSSAALHAGGCQQATTADRCRQICTAAPARLCLDSIGRAGQGQRQGRAQHSL